MSVLVILVNLGQAPARDGRETKKTGVVVTMMVILFGWWGMTQLSIMIDLTLIRTRMSVSVGGG